MRKNINSINASSLPFGEGRGGAQPKVTLVGAGPGDPDLLTIKGANALAEAQVVLYDALANEEILTYAPKKSIKIFVGKRKGCHTYSQDEINQLIVDNALTYGHVVRLKGGDPFIFGRGSEEIDFVESFGIPTAVVPGISSSVAVPAYQGISLTKRGVSESFWVITGTTSDRKLSTDVALAAQSSATVVILMGMSKLAQIVSLFQNESKGAIPVAIIQNGTTPKEKIGVGTIDTIQEVVAEKKLSSPAIIVIGEVVRESNKLKDFYHDYLIEKDNKAFLWRKPKRSMEERNELYPVFLKLHQLNVLIVGGGNVGLEKLSFMLKSSPNANVEVVAPRFLPELEALVVQHPSVKLTAKKFNRWMLRKRHLVIACTDDLKVNKRVFDLCSKRHLICNIADTPQLCDYYLGGIVTKGNVKIAISTNGKSPTTAKRLREFFEEIIPDDINTMVENLNEYRKTLKGNFEEKVQKMNEITESLKNKK